MIPSLSVVHTVPFFLRNEAPALSSPPKPKEPSTRPSTNHLNPTGTSAKRRPKPADTRSIMDELTNVFPIAASGRHPCRLENRYWIATERKWLGFINPTPVSYTHLTLPT